MKRITTYVLIIFLIAISGCSKEDVVSTNSGFVKTIALDQEMAAVAGYLIDDNKQILVGRSLDNSTPGWILKLNEKGEEVWRKQIPLSNRVLWKSIPVPGSGFITMGYEDEMLSELTVCSFNTDGELASEKTVALPVKVRELSIADILQLKNGNFVIAISNNGLGRGYVLITDNAFNLISTTDYESPDINYFGCFFYGIQQLNDSAIGLAASAIYQNGVDRAYTNAIFIKANLDGQQISNTLLIDSLRSETINCLVANSNGVVAISSSMTGWNNGQGLYVNYWQNINSQFISGAVNVVKFNIDGSFRERRSNFYYPGNGVINSARPTSDGGFILCGTVNQNNSSTVASNTEIFLVKLDAAFNTQWSKAISTSYPSFGIDAFQTVDGGYSVAGHQHTFNSKFNMIVIKTDSNGNY
jgi:hypothetical protein